MRLDSSDEMPPGIWAALISRLEWPSARSGQALASELLLFLSRLPVVREPTFRAPSTSIPAMIGSTLRTTEAARMQISGSLAPIPCQCCSEGRGMFWECVVISEWPGREHCANCHANGEEGRCYIIYPIQALGGGNEAYSY